MQFYVNDKKVFAPSAETRSKLAATLVNLRIDLFAVCDLDEGDYIRARAQGTVIVTDNTRRYTDMPGVVHTPKFFAALRNVKKR